MLRISIARSAADLDNFADVWNALDRHAGTIFQSYQWNRLAADIFCARESPYVVLAQNDNGAAIVPAAISSTERRLVFLGEQLFDYRDVLSMGDPSLLQHAWLKLAALELPFSLTALSNAARAQWDAFAPVPFCGAPAVMRCDTSPEQLEAAHRKLGRFARRLRRQGITLQHHSADRSALLRWLYEQKAAQYSSSSTNIFADTRRIDFLVRAAEISGPDFELFTYAHGSALVAALVALRDRDVRRFYTIYYDEAWSRESPGQILVYEVTLLSLREGLDCDYMTGEQPHKMRLATRTVPLYRVNLTADELNSALSRDQKITELAA